MILLLVSIQNIPELPSLYAIFSQSPWILASFYYQSKPIYYRIVSLTLHGNIDEPSMFKANVASLKDNTLNRNDRS